MELHAALAGGVHLDVIGVFSYNIQEFRQGVYAPKELGLRGNSSFQACACFGFSFHDASRFKAEI